MDPGPCMLPPCVICGDRSSGYHYGATTCEACKGFFRRCTLRKQNDFFCMRKNNCTILPSSKRACKGCRYRKCIQNGMSKEAKNKGRYTLEKKNNNIAIVKSMEKLGKIKNNGVISNETQYNHEKEMDELILKLSKVGDFKRHTDSSLEELYRIEDEYMEQRELDEIIFGNIDHLSREDCDEIYKSKGIDVDGFQKKVQTLQPHLKTRVLHFVSFAKSVPGFNDIPAEDQFAIMTQTSLEHWLFHNSLWTNTEKRVIANRLDNNIIFGYMDIMRFANQQVETCEKVWNTIERIQRLELSPEECNVVSAMSLLTGGVQLSTKGREIVSKIVDHLLDMLIHLMNKNHDAEEHTLPRLMIILMNIKELQKFTESLKKGLRKSASGCTYMATLIAHLNNNL